MFHHPQHPHLNTSERNWSERLENVLNDYDALNLFKSWMGVDEDSSEHPIRLHFAIIAYKDMVDKKDPRCLQLAKDIYNKFLRQKSGLCAFVESPVRESIGRKMRQLGNGGEAGVVPPANLFDTCLQQVDTFLRKQHALFVSSQEFLDFFNSSLTLQDIPEGGAGIGQHASTSKNVSGQRKSRRCHGEVGTGAAVPRLTATSLMRSQRDRETALGQSSVEKMFKPVCKYPYVGNATTSKNDSAVSSSFSSDANGKQNHAGNTIRMTREEHRRINPVLANFPRPDPPAVSSANQFRHDIEEGRRKFAEMLIEKLHVVIAKYKQYERMNEQIEKIAQGPKCSAREVIISSSDVNPGMEDCTAGLDADDDVDQYFKQRMLPDSANSQQSPQIPQSRRTRRGRSPRSTSPDNSNAVLFPESTAGTQPQPHPLMTQSYINPISREYPIEFARQPTNYLNTGDEMATSMRFAHQQRAGINASDVRYSHHKSCSPNRINEVSSGFTGMMATTSYYGDVVIPPNVQNMSQSAYVCPNSNRQNKIGFAPPPGSTQTHHQIPPQLKPKDGYCENDEDTSGIGSMTTHFTSTYFSDHSTNSYNKQRAAVFKKARQLSSAQGAGQQVGAVSQSKPQPKTGVFGENKRRTGVQEFSQSSLPRPKQNDASLPSPSAPKMTISYKPCKSGDKDVIPVVANIPQKSITFKEFRRHLSIPSKDRRQFFFKTSCEDGSAPYQLLLVNDDSAILPVFEGKISAECRSLSEDSE